MNKERSNNRVALIVAASENNVIGHNNQLPWHLPKDLQYFKSLTSGCLIIMGRKTYESIGRALPNRHNIVVSRNHDYRLNDADIAHDLTSAVTFAEENSPLDQTIYIIGGSSLFAEALDTNQVDTLYLTRVAATVEGDVLLPHIDWQQWQLVHETKHVADEKNCYDMNFQVYQKKS